MLVRIKTYFDNIDDNLYRRALSLAVRRVEVTADSFFLTSIAWSGRSVEFPPLNQWHFRDFLVSARIGDRERDWFVSKLRLDWIDNDGDETKHTMEDRRGFQYPAWEQRL